MAAEQKDLGDHAMGDGVHATVSVKQPTMIQDQSSQTTYHPKKGEKAEAENDEEEPEVVLRYKEKDVSSRAASRGFPFP